MLKITRQRNRAWQRQSLPFGETTLQFTVTDDVSAFEITFVESANSQPYTMTVTFDSGIKDGDTLTVQFNVNEATQEIVYNQI